MESRKLPSSRGASFFSSKNSLTMTTKGLAEIQRRAEELDRDPSMGMTMEEFQHTFGR